MSDREDKEDKPEPQAKGREKYLQRKDAVREYTFRKIATPHLDQFAGVVGGWC